MQTEKDVDPTIGPDRQFWYRSGVGMLLYLVKHSRPDIANATRELTKVLDGATGAHWKATTRIIKYVFDTKMFSLKLKPYGKIATLTGISDCEIEKLERVFMVMSYITVELLSLGNQNLLIV
jgi:hypothetical protein